MNIGRVVCICMCVLKNGGGGCEMRVCIIQQFPKAFAKRLDGPFNVVYVIGWCFASLLMFF